jgi:hypothetical protein
MKWSPREKEEDSPGEKEKQNKNKNSFKKKKNRKLSKFFHKKLRNRAHSDCQLLNCSVERTG